ncbi:MAG: outer membrane beta-barrel protein [Bacteroidales bacterium]|nr:outer membrane beta-barrel protein [Bacteroidales bacterium]MBN2818059.1 outer membrane beta-barrel protein [Bacteroidales bacterium]
MKQIILIGLIAGFGYFANAQEADSSYIDDNNPGYEVIENEEVQIKTDEAVKKGKADTTTFKLGDKEVSIIEENGETNIKLKDITKGDKENYNVDKEFDFNDDEFKDESDDVDNKSSKKFKGHWSGFEFGLNNYVNADNSLNRDPGSEFMDINTGRSWNFNLNFSQYSFPIVSNNLGLVTGMGIEWSNYHFEGQNSITKNKTDRLIEELPLDFNADKNKLKTTYLTIPMLLELQLGKGKRSDRFYVSGGIIGGLKINSKTIVTYYESGSKQKDKTKSDYYLTPFRYGATARIGYKIVDLYANYYLTPLFIEDRGPELHPVAVGMKVTF